VKNFVKTAIFRRFNATGRHYIQINVKFGVEEVHYRMPNVEYDHRLLTECERTFSDNAAEEILTPQSTYLKILSLF